MTLIKTDLSSVPSKKAKKKRMLEIFETDDHIRVCINYSSLDLIQKCPRSAFYRLHRELQTEIEHPALTTGSGFHRAMEVWHKGDPKDRKRSSFKSDEGIQLALAGTKFETGCLRTKAIQAYLKETESLASNPDLKARDRGNCCDILDSYFDYYIDDEDDF